MKECSFRFLSEPGPASFKAPSLTQGALLSPQHNARLELWEREPLRKHSLAFGQSLFGTQPMLIGYFALEKEKKKKRRNSLKTDE